MIIGVKNYSRAPKSELFCVRISDCIFCPKSKQNHLDFRCCTSLDHFSYKGSHTFFNKMVKTSIRFRLVGISDGSKTKRFRSNFGHMPKTELFNNQTKVVCPKSELVQISVLYCICVFFNIILFKLKFKLLLLKFRNHLEELDKKKPVIVCGDLNVAHTEIDLANPKTNKKNAGFTKEERESECRGQSY